MNTYRYMNGLLCWILRLHWNSSRMSLWLIPYILSTFKGLSLSLHFSRSSLRLGWLLHAQALAGTSWLSWLRLLIRYTSWRQLMHAPCKWHLPSSWSTWLHWLPARTHLLHLRCEEWTLASLQKDIRIQNLLCNAILQMSQKTTGLQKATASIMHSLVTFYIKYIINLKLELETWLGRNTKYLVNSNQLRTRNHIINPLSRFTYCIVKLD